MTFDLMLTLTSRSCTTKVKECHTMLCMCIHGEVSGWTCFQSWLWYDGLNSCMYQQRSWYVFGQKTVTGPASCVHAVYVVVTIVNFNNNIWVRLIICNHHPFANTLLRRRYLLVAFSVKWRFWHCWNEMAGYLVLPKYVTTSWGPHNQ